MTRETEAHGENRGLPVFNGVGRPAVRPGRRVAASRAAGVHQQLKSQLVTGLSNRFLQTTSFFG
jgi:hypothetical protein